MDYADHWARKLFGDDPVDSGKIIVSEKTQEAAKRLKPDITVDDEHVVLGKVDILV
ncbi:MAG: hypothetical protein QME66_05405 [Candidatus Eisenbacteria bacterium]|nr:hypothetical protein [Candidatus Eisenbacteria bacterium]